jgi:hypothetical protein
MSMGATAEFFEMMMENVHTTIPATFVSGDGHKATVRPSLGYMLSNGQRMLIPDIEGVPLLMLGTNAFAVELELQEGDPLLLLVLSADPANWRKREWADPVHAASPLRHDLNGCVAIPLCLANKNRKNRITVSKNGAVEFVNDAGALVQLHADGLVAVANGSASVKGLMDDMWAEMKGLTTDMGTHAAALTAAAGDPVKLSATGGALTTAITARLSSVAVKSAKVSTLLK